MLVQQFSHIHRIVVDGIVESCQVVHVLLRDEGRELFDQKFGHVQAVVLCGDMQKRSLHVNGLGFRGCTWRQRAVQRRSLHIFGLVFLKISPGECLWKVSKANQALSAQVLSKNGSRV